ncbi:MAG TPA: FGGY family carbohydrate kinase, partial [Candidatus Limnocylindria bacterium]
MADGLLAVDVGTGRAKVGVVGLDGELIAFADRSYGLIEGGQAGWVEQDAAVWWAEARDAIRAAVAASRGTTIVGACIGGQGPS